jgi:hypothetical protein
VSIAATGVAFVVVDDKTDALDLTVVEGSEVDTIGTVKGRIAALLGSVGTTTMEEVDLELGGGG